MRYRHNDSSVQAAMKPLRTAARIWQGGGVLRVMPAGKALTGHPFLGERAHVRRVVRQLRSAAVQTWRPHRLFDVHLDLWITADGVATWKDEDEANAAVGTTRLAIADLATARAAGHAIIGDLAGWPEPIRDWRSFRPDPALTVPQLPSDWSASR